MHKVLPSYLVYKHNALSIRLTDYSDGLGVDQGPRMTSRATQKLCRIEKSVVTDISGSLTS